MCNTLRDVGHGFAAYFIRDKAATLTIPVLYLAYRVMDNHPKQYTTKSQNLVRREEVDGLHHHHHHHHLVFSL
jgi:hypothetical protein